MEAVRLDVDEEGNFLGKLTIQGTQRLRSEGHTSAGEYVLTIRDPEGNVLATFPTTAEVTRIQIEPLPTQGT